MRYTVTKQVIDVVGQLWQGCTAATRLTLSAHDMSNLGDPHNREDVENWIALNSGDFASITDFRADFTVTDPSGNATRDIVHAWTSEENEIAFSDCLFPSED